MTAPTVVEVAEIVDSFRTVQAQLLKQNAMLIRSFGQLMAEHKRLEQEKRDLAKQCAELMMQQLAHWSDKKLVERQAAEAVAR